MRRSTGAQHRGERHSVPRPSGYVAVAREDEGGYHVKGKNEPEYQRLLADTDALVKAGAFAIVLELVAPRVAKELANGFRFLPSASVPGRNATDSLVTPDLLGMLPWYSLKHVKPRLNAAEQMRAVVKDWKQSVEAPKR